MCMGPASKVSVYSNRSTNCMFIYKAEKQTYTNFSRKTLVKGIGDIFQRIHWNSNCFSGSTHKKRLSKSVKYFGEQTSFFLRLSLLPPLSSLLPPLFLLPPLSLLPPTLFSPPPPLPLSPRTVESPLELEDRPVSGHYHLTPRSKLVSPTVAGPPPPPQSPSCL